MTCRFPLCSTQKKKKKVRKIPAEVINDRASENGSSSARALPHGSADQGKCGSVSKARLIGLVQKNLLCLMLSTVHYTQIKWINVYFITFLYNV